MCHPQVEWVIPEPSSVDPNVSSKRKLMYISLSPGRLLLLTYSYSGTGYLQLLFCMLPSTSTPREADEQATRMPSLVKHRLEIQLTLELSDATWEHSSHSTHPPP